MPPIPRLLLGFAYYLEDIPPKVWDIGHPRYGKPRAIAGRYLGPPTMPGRRDWYANLIADGRFTFHLKQPFAADLVAVATPVTDPEERRRLLEPITRTWGASARIEAFVARSPLVVVAFPDLAAAA